MMHGSWDIEHDRELFVILDCFLPFCPMDPENQNFKKKKKAAGDIVLHRCTCTINNNHIMYGSWDMEHDGNFLSFYPSNSLSNSNHFTLAKKMLMRKLYNRFHVGKIRNSCLQFSKNCIFSNIQLKGVVNWLPPFKNLSDHRSRFLMGKW